MPKPIDNLTIDGEKLDANVLTNLTPSSELLLSMDGASTLTLAIDDPNREILESGVLARTRRGKIPSGLELTPYQRLGKVQLGFEGTFWRLSGVTISGPITTLTFEQEIVARLRAHTRFHRFTRRYRDSAGKIRGISSRGGVIAFAVSQVKNPSINARIFEGNQKIKDDQNDKDQKKKVANKGIPTGADIKIKGVKADDTQIGEINTALGVADSLHVTSKKVLLAMVCAGIGESGFRAIPNAAGSPYGGVFQGKVKSNAAGPAQFRLEDTAGQAHYFLKGGKGFQSGGAIALAKQQPSLSPGAIATRVEASGELPAFYDKYRDEAEKILLAYGAGDPDAPQQIRGQYSYTIGTPKNAKDSEIEDYFESCLRIAREVNTYFFATTQGGDFPVNGRPVAIPAGEMFIYATGAQLLKSQPAYTLAEQVQPGDPRGTYAVGLFDSGDWHYNKPAGNLSFSGSLPDRWFAAPGLVAEVLRMGPFTGRWLTGEIRQPLDAAIADITLVRPSPEKPEPSGGKVTTREVVGSSESGIVAGKLQLPATFTPTHQTAGLPGYPAIDVMAKAGTSVGSPIDGKVTKLSGRSPSAGAYQGQGGPFGWSIYIEGGGRSYFLTHFGSRDVKVGDRVKRGQKIGTVGDYPGATPDHIHEGLHNG